MTFDSRWKNPQGSDPKQLHLWAQDIIKELRRGDYLPGAGAVAYDNGTSGLTADDVQAAIDEVEARVDDLEALPQGATLIGSGSLTGASVVLATSIPQTYAKLLLRLTGLSFDTAARHFLLQVSTDNSSYDTTAGSYVIFAFSGLLGVAGLAGGISQANAADVGNIGVEISGYQAGAYPVGYALYRATGGASANYSMYDASTDAINALRVIVGGGAGNFDAGTYALYGVR